MIPVAKPILSGEEIDNIKAVLESGILAQGDTVAKFEEEFARYVDAKQAVATNSGTSALHTVLAAMGFKKDDEIVTTSFTFIATATSILMQGAKPIFCDIDSQTYNIDPDLLQEAITKKTKALIVVHLYGLSCDMKPILEIAEDRGLKVIEDACQAHGAEYKGKKTGTMGDVGVFSFYPTKNITTGEGGMITTSDQEIAQRCRVIRNHGQSERYLHQVLGYNYRMTNLAAAIGVSQLNMLDRFNSKRRENARYYDQNLNVDPPFVPEGLKHVYHQYTIEVDDREGFLKHLESLGVGYGVYYPIPIHKQPLFKEYNDQIIPVAENASKRVVSLPVHPGLTEEERDQVVNAVNSYV